MNLETEIKAYGCHDLVLLEDKPTYRHLDYLDLLKLSGNGSIRVSAIAEFQSRPMLYIVSNDYSKGDYDNEKIVDLQCLLANRGERAYLAVLSPGEMNVYPANLDRSVLAKCPKRTITQKSPEAPLFFQNVVSGFFTLPGQPDEPDYIFETIRDLMTKSSKDLIKKFRNPLDVLSFLGRALFLRFLWDRKIILPNELPTICPQAQLLRDCFSNVNNSVATCGWLDKTFNGDMLPLSGDYEDTFNDANQQTNGTIFLHLQAILEGWDHIQGSAYQKTLDWGDLDFAHIPIGVLSQVYEKFSKDWDPRQRQQTSAYYTPKNIARYLVDDAFEGVTDKKNAQILDPSCGAGIFLVLAFRKLVAAHWEQDGERPGTRTIQSILYNQLCGFDISESALRLAALSLYITAIELNGTPRPPKSLKFPKPLQGSVLHNHRKSEEVSIDSFVLGSLRSDISDAFNDRFDIVIGNPPWSRLREDKVADKKLNKIFTELTRQILTNRGLEDIARKYHNPDNNPDLPFLWRSTQWAKPGGIIAMALPGRIFLKQTEGGMRAFNAILRGIEITGILNGSNLSDSAVWPGMNQPFMLFFARNQVPPDNHHFYFVTPHFEKYLNEKGRIRIDYQSAQPVAASETAKKPWLLKALAVGTILDSDIVLKLDNLGWPTVETYWRNHGLYSGLGYNLSPNQKQSDASFMLGLPDFIPPANDEFSVNLYSLDKFKNPTAHMPRCKELYTPPLLLV